MLFIETTNRFIAIPCALNDQANFVLFAVWIALFGLGVLDMVIGLMARLQRGTLGISYAILFMAVRERTLVNKR